MSRHSIWILAVTLWGCALACGCAQQPVSAPGAAQRVADREAIEDVLARANRL